MVNQNVVSGAPNKEWKPKSTNNIASAEPPNAPTATTDLAPSSSEHVTVSVPAPDPNESTSMVTEVERKLDELDVSERQHVIIPNHLQVCSVLAMNLSITGAIGNILLVFSGGSIAKSIGNSNFLWTNCYNMLKKWILA